MQLYKMYIYLQLYKNNIAILMVNDISNILNLQLVSSLWNRITFLQVAY